MAHVAAGSHYFPAPYSLIGLPADLKHGLLAPGLLGLLSVTATTILLSFICYRFSTWRKHYRTFVGYNQYVVLIMNLLIADLFQGISFLISFHWIAVDGILAPTSTCFAQGFLLNLGDLSSGFFILAIALHTFYTTVNGRRIGHVPFTAGILVSWAFALCLTIIGPAMYRERYFVRAGAWCWASGDYERDRLALHYIWIFIVQFGIVVIYAAIFLRLKQALRHMMPAMRSQSGAYSKVDRAAKLMVLYPFFYILLTLPLSAGRMWSAAHEGTTLPNKFQCVAGAMIASCGWVDVLLYTLTRKTLILGSSPRDLRDRSTAGEKASVGVKEISFGGITQTRTIIVSAVNAVELQNIDEEEHEDVGRGQTIHQGQRPNHSRTGSMDPIVCGGHMGVGADKNASNAFVTSHYTDGSSDDERPSWDHAEKGQSPPFCGGGSGRDS